MSVAVKNIAEFDGEAKAWFAAVRETAEKAAVGLATHAFKEVLRTTAQYSGTTVANWKMSAGSPDYSFEADPFGTKGDRTPHYHVGSQRAQQYATSRGVSIGNFKLGQTIFITNSTVSENKVDREGYHDMGRTYIAKRLEDGLVELRPINEGASHMVLRAKTKLANRYKSIGKGDLANPMRY